MCFVLRILRSMLIRRILEANGREVMASPSTVAKVDNGAAWDPAAASMAFCAATLLLNYYFKNINRLFIL